MVHAAAGLLVRKTASTATLQRAIGQVLEDHRVPSPGPGARRRTCVELGVIRTGENNVASRLGYRLDHVEDRPPEAPAESGRLQVWTRPAMAAGG